MPAAKASSAAGVLEEGEGKKIPAPTPANRPPKIQPDTVRPSFSLGTMLFCSGMAGLIYQILWIRQLTLVVGIEVYSITIAVSAFFAGLACGSVLLGRLADRATPP